MCTCTHQYTSSFRRASEVPLAAILSVADRGIVSDPVTSGFRAVWFLLLRKVWQWHSKEDVTVKFDGGWKGNSLPLFRSPLFNIAQQQPSTCQPGRRPIKRGERPVLWLDVITWRKPSGCSTLFTFYPTHETNLIHWNNCTTLLSHQILVSPAKETASHGSTSLSLCTSLSVQCVLRFFVELPAVVMGAAVSCIWLANILHIQQTWINKSIDLAFICFSHPNYMAGQ